MKMMKKRSKDHSYDYDVCLSFAGEDRQYIRKIANVLRARGIRVFYDEYLQADLWGKDLYTHLDDIYQNAARYCVLFASKHYAKKVWTNHERESAQARAIRQHSEYILPARLDSTAIPGIRPTVGHVDARKMKPLDLAKLIEQKVGKRQKREYFPPVPDRLFAHMKVRLQKEKDRLAGRALDFFEALKRMNYDERHVVFVFFLHACPADLPSNVHINLDLLRRVTGCSNSKLLRLLGAVRSLGFYVSIRHAREHNELAKKQKIVVLEWHDLSTDEDLIGNATVEASATVDVASENFCEDHSLPSLLDLDFSQLSSATYKVHNHGTEQVAAADAAQRRG